MHSIETGTESARKPVSMHPLWSESVDLTEYYQPESLYPSRYAFPVEPRDGLIDLTEDEEPFYFNPYSGELSLDFPKAERTCRGGILAYAMPFSLPLSFL